MIPLYIAGCFGVLHPARARRAVLICGALSDESLNAYRPLAFLAGQLAEADFPTLRLAYYGTGDSAGEDDESGRLPQWLDGIKAGVAWLREQCGAEAVTLIAHRAGAALAARAACDCEAVDSLVLLSPLSGRNFLHELTLAAKISQRVWQTSHAVDSGTWFESHGLRIDHPTRDALNKLDLRKLPSLPAQHVLVLEQETRPATKDLVAGLQARGGTASAEALADVALLQRDSHQAEVPRATFGRILEWLHALPAFAPAPANAVRQVETTLQLGSVRETPVQFGPDDTLFGILSQPAWSAPAGPAVLLVNTSANPRMGNARIAVDIARQLAADGVPALRMDASGMGDTALESGDVGRPYSETVTADVVHAAAELRRRTQRPVVVLGICSGAYHALQAACRDPAIAGLALVNLQRFVWREGDPPDIVRKTDLRPTAFYVRNIFGWQAWMRLLRADFDVANLARVLAMRMVRRGVARLDPVLSVALRGATKVGRVRRIMQTLQRRGVPVLYVLGCNDPGVEELAEYFGSGGRRLQRQANVTMRTLQDADHTLSAAPVRAALVQELRAWLQLCWRIAEAAPARSGGVAQPVAAAPVPAL